MTALVGPIYLLDKLDYLSHSSTQLRTFWSAILNPIFLHRSNRGLLTNSKSELLKPDHQENGFTKNFSVFSSQSIHLERLYGGKSFCFPRKAESPTHFSPVFQPYISPTVYTRSHPQFSCSVCGKANKSFVTKQLNKQHTVILLRSPFTRGLPSI